MELNGKIIVSACLTGKKCRYNGEHALNKDLMAKLKDMQVISYCPEIMAGLPTPRSSCNLEGGTGFDVIEGTAKVIGIDGKDYTNEFVEGAKLMLKKALDNGVTKAYLKKNSPSCGYGKVYAEGGTKIIDGNGVSAELLNRNDIEIESL